MTGGEIAEGVGTEAGAVEGFDVPALAGEHAADLVVAAFGEGEGGGAGAGDFKTCGEAGFGLAAEDEIAPGEDSDEGGVEVFVQSDLVGFLEVGLGGGVAMDEGALIGDEEETAGVLVEAADGGDGGFAVEPGIGEEFVDVGAFGVAVGAAVADGFVEHDEEAVGRVEGPAVEGDTGVIGFLVGTQGGDTVDEDTAFSDPGGGLAAGAVAEGGEDLVEAAHGGGKGD